MSNLDYRIEGRINRNVLAGIMLIIIGTLGILFPFKFSRAVVYIAGALMLIAGILMGFLYLSTQGKRKSYMLKALVLMTLGFIALMCPILGAKIFVGVLIVFFLFAGITNFILAKSIKNQPGYKAAIAVGILSLLLDVILIMGWQTTSQFFLGVFLGILLFSDGLVFLRMGKKGGE